MNMYVIEGYNSKQKKYTPFVNISGTTGYTTLNDGKLMLKTWRELYPKIKFRLMLYNRAWALIE